MINSSIYNGSVIHKRFKPKKHFFKYKVFSLFLDLSELKELNNKLNFFSLNKFNLISFYEKDHGERDGSSILDWVKNNLRSNNVSTDNIKVKLLCYPRILGYVFNPLSVIYCFDGGKLIAVLYEVKNTHNEQHTYCFANKYLQNRSLYQHQCKKIFYVSPFIKMNCYYKFSLKQPSKKLSLLIEQFDEQDNKILLASQIGKKINFLGATIIISFIKNPLMTFRVIFGIHYQAFKILLKGGKYYSRNKKPTDSISFEGNL